MALSAVMNSVAGGMEDCVAAAELKPKSCAVRGAQLISTMAVMRIARMIRRGESVRLLGAE
jgi:hypothetical protein